MHFSGSSRCLSLDSQLRSIWRETPCARSSASRVRPASLSAHDAVAVQKPVSTCVNTGLTCVLCGTSSPHPRLAAPVRSQLSAGPACRAPRLSLKPAIGLLEGRADVAHGTADALGVASSAGFSPKVDPLFVDVFPELVGEKREKIFLGS